jgi:hypothetical protein
MTAYLVQLTHPTEHYALRYLAFRPFDRTWGWFAGDIRHATPVSAADADRLAALFRLRVLDERITLEGMRRDDPIDVIPDPRARPVFNDARLLHEQFVEARR